MRIEIHDCMGYCHAIDSTDLELIGRWFAEKSKIIMSANTQVNHPAPLHIWPSDKAESDLIPVWHRQTQFTQESILALAGYLTQVSAEWPHEEAQDEPGLIYSR